MRAVADTDKSLQRGILAGMVLGALLGLPLNLLASNGIISGEWPQLAATLGDALGGLFLQLLKMLVVPLIFASLVTGVSRVQSASDLGRLGGRTMLFYLGSSLVAILTGLAMVNLLQPGVGADLDLSAAKLAAADLTVDPQGGSVWHTLWDQLRRMIPENPIMAAANGEMLALIFFSLLFGIFLQAGTHPGLEVVRSFFEGLFDVMMRMTLWVVKLSPFGVFGFMLYAAADKGPGVFVSLGLYMLTVAGALAIHACVTLPLALRFLAKRSPLEFARAMSPALLTAFGTASSNATLPLTMTCAEQRGGVQERTSSFVFPLGATINMDGTALYEAVAALFIAQAYGLELSFGQQLIVALTTLLASVGAAGIPHAGTVMLVIVLSAVGLPTEGVGLILAVDRVLDLGRTCVNVWSDSTAAAVVDHLWSEPARSETAATPPAR